MDNILFNNVTDIEERDKFSLLGSFTLMAAIMLLFGILLVVRKKKYFKYIFCHLPVEKDKKT